MKRLVFLLPIVIVFFNVSFVCKAADSADSADLKSSVDPAKAAEIWKMLKLNGTEKLMDQVKEQMISLVRKKQPNISEAIWDRVQKDMNTHELLEKMIPLYDKYYSLEDIKAANAFYASPAGVHISEAAPQLMTESSRIAQGWAREAALKAMLEVQQENDRSAK